MTAPLGKAPRSGQLKLERALGFAFILFLLLMWEVIVRAGLLDSSYLPRFTKVLEALGRLAADLSLPGALGISLVRAMVGYLLAIVLVVPPAILLGYHTPTYNYLEPLIEFLRPIPPPAIIPFAMFFIGVNEWMRYFVILFACGFPILVNTMDGSRNLDPALLDTARIFGLRSWSMLRKIVLPAASPYIMSGLRVSLPIALILVVTAEMVGSSNGIGVFILRSQRDFKIAETYAGVATLALLSYLLNALFERVERRLMAWHRGATQK